MSGAEFSIGIKTKDFVLMCSDRTALLQGIMCLKQDKDKSFQLTDKVMMICFGEGGDAEQFGQYITKNLQLYKMRNQYELSPKAAAHFTRRTISENLRTQDAYLVFLLLGGYDSSTESTYLTSMDYLGTQFENNFLSQGFGGRFCGSLLDNIYRPDWTEAEAMDALKMCLKEVKKRFAISLPDFQPWIINKDGIRTLDVITV